MGGNLSRFNQIKESKRSLKDQKIVEFALIVCLFVGIFEERRFV